MIRHCARPFHPVLVLAIGLIHGGCGAPPPPLPALPEVDVSGLVPAVEAQIREARAAVEREPQDAERNGRLGMLLHANRRTAAAAVLYARARLLQPAAFRWAYYHALALEDNGHSQEAIEALLDAAAKDPSYAPARLKLARLLASAGQTEQAVAHCDEMLSRYAARADVQLECGRVAQRAGEAAAAIERFSAAIDLGGDFGAAHYALAELYRRQGEEEAADEHYRLYERFREVRLSVSDPLRARLNEFAVTDRALVLEAQKLAEQGDLAGAIARMENALAVNPHSASTSIKLIQLYDRTGRSDDAEALYRRVQRDGVEAGHHFAMGNLYLHAGRLDEAQAAFGRALTEDPQHADALAQLGAVAEARGDTDSAVGHYRAALAVEPSHRPASFLLGRQLALRGDYVEAFGLLEKAAQPEDEMTPVVLRAMAGIRAKTGAFDDALRLARDARRIVTRVGADPRLAAQLDADIETFKRLRDRASGGTSQ